jgi:hypothetical protein
MSGRTGLLWRQTTFRGFLPLHWLVSEVWLLEHCWAIRKDIIGGVGLILMLLTTQGAAQTERPPVLPQRAPPRPPAPAAATSPYWHNREQGIFDWGRSVRLQSDVTVLLRFGQVVYGGRAASSQSAPRPLLRKPRDWVAVLGSCCERVSAPQIP